MYTLAINDFDLLFGSEPGIISAIGRKSGAKLNGDPAGLGTEFTVYDPVSHSISTIGADGFTVKTVPQSPSLISWHFSVKGGAKAVICAKVTGNRITFKLSGITETENMQIVTVRLNGLAAAEASDPSARMALPAHGGRLIDPADCSEGKHDHRYNWILDSFGSIAVVYNSFMTAVVGIHSMDDQLTSVIGQRSFAQSGALLRHRYTRFDMSYRKAKDPDDIETPAGEEFYGCEDSFVLPGDPIVTVDLIAHDRVDPESGWTIGAKFVRDSLPDKPRDMYRDRMIYKIFIGAPDQPVRTDIDGIRRIITDFAARTGNAGQLPYLVGFQHEGHDSKYPDVFTLNPALGSIEDLSALSDEMSKFNCLISFHDNFDDAYRNSPSWDSDDISRDSTGHLLRGGVWNGVQAYWNSMPYYDRYKADRRIERTKEMYPFIRDTYHLDVLTASVFRVDFRKGSPTGKQTDLEARKSIAARFRKHGLDLTSEACGLPFVGSFSYFWHMQRVPREMYPGDRRIPMVPFLVHGKADYAGSHSMSMHDIMDGLLYGGFFCDDIGSDSPTDELINGYYMLQAPLNMLRNDLAESYSERNGRKTIRYRSGAEISVNFETEECSVTIDGIRYIENGSAMIPQKDGSTIIYRYLEEPYNDVLWHTGHAAGTVFIGSPLGMDAEEREWIADENGCIPVDTDIRVPYRVTVK